MEDHLMQRAVGWACTWPRVDVTFWSYPLMHFMSQCVIPYCSNPLPLLSALIYSDSFTSFFPFPHPDASERLDASWQAEALSTTYLVSGVDERSSLPRALLSGRAWKLAYPLREGVSLTQEIPFSTTPSKFI